MFFYELLCGDFTSFKFCSSAPYDGFACIFKILWACKCDVNNNKIHRFQRNWKSEDIENDKNMFISSDRYKLVTTTVNKDKFERYLSDKFFQQSVELIRIFYSFDWMLIRIPSIEFTWIFLVKRLPYCS